MGAIGGLLGLGGGASGTGYQAPQAYGNGVNQILNPVNSDQVQNAYGYNQNALAQQQALLQAIQGQNGIGNQSNVYNQLQGVVNGTGPNPAQAMLNQSTGQNVANQAALAAGQRGAGSNVGLIARQAANQGANLQQQAVGQGASLQAQQALNALNASGNIANTQVANQIGATTANTGAQQAEQQALLNAIAQQNNANVGLQSNLNSTNSGLAQTQLKGQQGLIGGLFNSGLGAVFGAEGGDTQGVIPEQTPVSEPLDQVQDSAAPKSSFGKFLKGMIPMAAGAMAQGGMTHDYRAGGNVVAKSSAQKAVKAGNSYANDKIPAVLSEGEVVIPRNVMQSKDPVEAAAKFVQAVMAKRKMK